LIATVRLPGGQRVIARLERPLAPGSDVTLTRDGGALSAR
jgi:hypothetical protein